MGLKSLKLRRETVTIADDETFDVRGLSLPDITRLVKKHGSALSVLLEGVASGQLGAALENIASIGAALADQAPAAAAEAIALAAGDGDPDAEEIRIAANLPVTVQLDALEKIGALTFVGELTPKKALEMVIRVARGLSGTLASVRS